MGHLLRKLKREGLRSDDYAIEILGMVPNLVADHQLSFP